MVATSAPRALVCALVLFAWGLGVALAGDDDTPFLSGEEQRCEQPALALERPGDAWQFVDLAKLRQQAEAKGEDTKGYATLRFRLWFGAKRANVYCWAWVDEETREQPLTTEAFVLTKVSDLRAAFTDPKISKPKLVKFGKRAAAMFSIEGALAEGGKQHAVLCAVCVRPEDNTICVLNLECEPEQLKELKKDFLKLLKKAKF